MGGQYNKSSLIGTAIVLPVLSLIAVILRFHVRLQLRRTFIGVDDWLILLAVVLVCGHGIIQILSSVRGVGGDPKNASEGGRDLARIAYEQKLIHAILVIEKVTYTSIKLSVLFLYRRIFGSVRWFRRTADALMVLMVCWGLGFLFLESFICVSDAPDSIECTAQSWVLLWFGITEVLGDCAILSLPYPMVRKLHKGRREKIGITVIFALGTLSTVMGIVRLGYVAKNFYAHSHLTFVNDTASAPTFWTTVEVSIGVVAACLPPLGPLLRMLPSPEKVYQSLRQRLASTRSHRVDSERGTGEFVGSDRTAVELPSDNGPQLHFAGDLEKGAAPHLSLVLPDSNRLSQVPALGVTAWKAPLSRL